ncbi:hypothetical protein H4582DRAFT_2096935 [Lactarius indigo]|nr:hypothetical protein H4582DRAFT_2096935 [Lactarius indigo]
MSLGVCSQAYWGMVSHNPAFATSPGGLSTLALLVFSVWRTRATNLLMRANHVRLVRPFERPVIGAMTVEEASVNLAKTCNVRLSPLSSIAVRNVHKAVAHVAAWTFVDAVLGPDVQSGDTEVYGTEDAHEEVERRAVIDAGRPLGGRSVDLLERIYNGAFIRHEIEHSDDSDTDDEEWGVRMLLSAIVLCRRPFPSALPGSSGVSIVLSPSPSPSR